MEQDNELFHFFYQIRKINLFGKVRKYREKSATNYFKNPTGNFENVMEKAFIKFAVPKLFKAAFKSIKRSF